MQFEPPIMLRHWAYLSLIMLISFKLTKYYRLILAYLLQEVHILKNSCCIFVKFYLTKLFLSCLLQKFFNAEFLVHNPVRNFIQEKLFVIFWPSPIKV